MVRTPRRRRVHGFLLLSLIASIAGAGQIDFQGPDGSGGFGLAVTQLPNGHFLVTDPYFDRYEPDWQDDVGAVHHYDASWQWLGSLTGAHAADHVGAGGIVVLTSGDYVVVSPDCDQGVTADVGAVTRCSQNGFAGQWVQVSPQNSLTGSSHGDRVGSDGATAIPGGGHVVTSSIWNNGTFTGAGAVTGCGASGPVGPVSAANSLVGSAKDDHVGSGGVVLVSSPLGNYLVKSPEWDNQGNADAGAVTWCSATTPVTGPVSAQNSLVGVSAADQVGSGGIVVLANGNYVVSSPLWNLDAVVTDAGAATWGSGSAGIAGPISSSNSLVGTRAADGVGSAGVFALPNGHYVVTSPGWDTPTLSGLGAATWCDCTTGRSGEVSALNSLIGIGAGDNVGGGGITVLSDGDYVVISPSWDNGGSSNAGAVTWCAAGTGRIAAVSAANSLTGSQTGDRVGSGGITPLTNGNYVIASPLWDQGALEDFGLITWGNGSSGSNGQVGPGNSIAGTVAGEMLGSEKILALTDGNYVICNPAWDSPAAINAGAVTWGNGSAPMTGPISSMNSLVGTAAGDQIGSAGITVLAAGRYVVASPLWDRGATVDAGAVTWCPGGLATIGEVTETNSLVGSAAGDQVGDLSVRTLSDGNYVVNSSSWDRGGITDAGAVTWCPAATGRTGPVSESNSLVGSTAGDRVGAGGVTVLSGGRFVVSSSLWDRGTVANAGAVTWCAGGATLAGTVSPANSLVGSSSGDQVGSAGIIVLTDGTYLVRSPAIDNGPITDSGAITPGSGTSGIIGSVNLANSVRGLSARGFLKEAQLPTGGQVVVGHPGRNTVSRFTPGNHLLQTGQSRDFGIVAIGSSSSLSFKVACAETPTVEGSSITFTGNSFSLTAGSIAVEGNSLIFDVTFTPDGGGLKQSTLQVTAGTTSLEAALTGTGNTPPTFSGFSFGTPFETMARLDPFKVLAFAADADGDALFITAASASAHGGTTAVRDGVLFYHPPADYEYDDSFTVTITDARGAHVSGPMNASMTDPFNSQPTNPVSVTLRFDGRNIIRFRAIPDHAYDIERSVDMQTWTVVDTGVADATGFYEFIDPPDSNDPKLPNAFYRLSNP